MRIEEHTQMGKMSVLVDGEMRQVDVPLTIVDTYHDDGRKDVTIKVPRLQSGAATPKAEAK